MNIGPWNTYICKTKKIFLILYPFLIYIKKSIVAKKLSSNLLSTSGKFYQID